MQFFGNLTRHGIAIQISEIIAQYNRVLKLLRFVRRNVKKTRIKKLLIVFKNNNIQKEVCCNWVLLFYISSHYRTSYSYYYSYSFYSCSYNLYSHHLFFQIEVWHRFTRLSNMCTKYVNFMILLPSLNNGHSFSSETNYL